MGRRGEPRGLSARGRALKLSEALSPFGDVPRMGRGTAIVTLRIGPRVTLKLFQVTTCGETRSEGPTNPDGGEGLDPGLT